MPLPTRTHTTHTTHHVGSLRLRRRHSRARGCTRSTTHPGARSRDVGGHEPYNKTMYAAVQTRDYLVPDTKREEAYQRSYTPLMRSRRALYIWGCYALIAVVVAVVIVYTLAACDWIHSQRTKWMEGYLHAHDLPMAWLVWTGSSSH